MAFLPFLIDNQSFDNQSQNSVTQFAAQACTESASRSDRTHRSQVWENDVETGT